MRAWIFQDFRQRQKHGPKTPWSVGWMDPEGRRRSKRIGSRSMAQKLRRKIEGQLAAGVYETQSRKSWSSFRTEYEAKIVPRLAHKTEQSIKTSLGHFERLIKPQKIATIKTPTIDDFIAQRQGKVELEPHIAMRPKGGLELSLSRRAEHVAV